MMLFQIVLHIITVPNFGQKQLCQNFFQRIKGRIQDSLSNKTKNAFGFFSIKRLTGYLFAQHIKANINIPTVIVVELHMVGYDCRRIDSKKKTNEKQCVFHWFVYLSDENAHF